MKIQIVGVGGHVPPHAVKNDRLVRAIPGWTAERIADKTGILERRYLWDFDEETGVTRAPEVISEPGPFHADLRARLRAALAMAGLEGADLDGLIVSTCTPDQNNFSHDALVLHRRVGMRPEAFAVHHDDGCGGALFALNMAQELIRSGCRRTVAVVGVNMISPLLDRDVYTRRLRHRDKDLGAFLTIYLFGDGAGAIILRAEPEARPGSGLVASYAANEQLDLVVRRSGGGMWPAQPGRAEYSDPAFYVDGQLVAECFGPYLRKAIDGALSRAGMELSDIERFYLHQANKRVLERFVREAGIDPARVPMNMDRYANTTTAGTLLALSEDLAAGAVQLGSGAPILMAAIGAGAQCAAHVIRL